MNPTTILDLPPALIDDVCYGMAPLPEIFNTYGYDEPTAETFRADTRFQRLISLRTAELDKDGITHKVRVGRLADKSMRVMMMRLDDPNTPLSVVNDIYKASAKNAGFEPKGAEVQAAGSGFSVIINLGGATKAKSIETVEVIAIPRQTYVDSEFEVVE